MNASMGSTQRSFAGRTNLNNLNWSTWAWGSDLNNLNTTQKIALGSSTGMANWNKLNMSWSTGM